MKMERWEDGKTAATAGDGCTSDWTFKTFKIRKMSKRGTARTGLAGTL